MGLRNTMGDVLVHTATWILLVGGGLFCLIGGIGLIRLPDFYARVHGAGLTDTLGATAILLGLILYAQAPLVQLKLAIVVVFLMFTTPTASHALVRAALSHGLRPRLHRQSFRFEWMEEPVSDAVAEEIEASSEEESSP